ncbi:uncharacterized protein NEMAJ01_0268 [Nematocida major]|uniref:uncharacterized protein n=1 Tax=Nematocida major TaxID=1912982 RepID=UPI002007452E|nr:uncharacterized protein NEMAJ01_0268 [Nematocida major]KAH9385372.1 hypothetical protein NEMAJ01_0268 [Nematocida major]
MLRNKPVLPLIRVCHVFHIFSETPSNKRFLDFLKTEKLYTKRELQLQFMSDIGVLNMYRISKCAIIGEFIFETEESLSIQREILNTPSHDEYMRYHNLSASEKKARMDYVPCTDTSDKLHKYIPPMSILSVYKPRAN